MRLSAELVVASTLPLVTIAQVRLPTVNPSDPRLFDWRPPGPGDSRSPCPGLNSLANHGFLPRDGRNVDLGTLIVGAFEGLGSSPEISALIGGIGLLSSRTPLSVKFDLEDLRKHQFLIEHDCSFSRQDTAVGNNNDFDPEIWGVTMSVIGGKSIVTPRDMGRARSVRLRDQRRRNPAMHYGLQSAAVGVFEIGMVLSALGQGNTRLDYLRSLFEQQRLPTHLGWRPTLAANNVASTLAIGGDSVLGEDLIADGLDVFFGSPADLFDGAVGALHLPADAFDQIRGWMSQLGFNTTGVDQLERRMRSRGVTGLPFSG
ncbi:hypothetical protein CDD80_3812 [Ophiocordyceps camponoti-rufipedis]|uniref:Heme haloperoxidase family profile domain-containing protein n=1 Tax=Ophiocordyceps camponoti-rufipedis TaxID=2004952 RepID=A0A2C5Y5U6_9HYPO|nr:hypothetical protein CDD80_3812 [Ophiocordyceps camponoti-rufipedis]